MTGSRRLALVVIAAMALLTSACGGSSGPQATLHDAMSRIGQIRAGQLSMRFTLAPNTAPVRDAVGFTMDGSFALDRRHRLPVLHVTYTQLEGTRSRVARIDSDGQSATLLSGGARIALGAQQQHLLAGALQGPQGLGGLPLHIDRWVNRPSQSPGPRAAGQPTDRVTGGVSLPNVLSDLNQLSGGQVGQRVGSGTSGSALVKTLRSSDFLAIVDRGDHLLRRLYLRAVLAPNHRISCARANDRVQPRPCPAAADPATNHDLHRRGLMRGSKSRSV